MSGDDPADPSIRHDLAATNFNIGGSYWSLTRPLEAFLAFRAGVDALEGLVNEYPAIVQYRRSQARCFDGCGDALQELGRPDEALAYFGEALAAWKKVVDDNPARYSEPVDLACTHNRIGWLHFGRGRISDALNQYEAARSIFQDLIDRFPPRLLPRTRDELSNVIINIAEIQRRQGRLAEARASCGKAIAIRAALIQDFPEVMNYRLRTGECQLRSGQVRQAAGDILGAAADWRRAIAFYQGLNKRAGEIAMFEAGCHAMLSSIAGMSGSGFSVDDGSSEADKAMAILRRLNSDGYRAHELRNESCLDPLRARSDFKLLMLDVDFPSDPFVR
jgi:tetratricopeptide (TPR) repeat protein